MNKKKIEAIYSALKTDHRNLKQRLRSLCDQTIEDFEHENIFSEFRLELMAHSKAEETVFYDRIQTEVKRPEIVFEAKEEHHLLENLLEQMSDTSLPPEVWRAKLNVLKENFEHHVKE